MNRNNINMIYENGGLRKDMRIIKNYNDNKLLYFACSALWNICQQNRCRVQVGKSGINKILNIIELNIHNELLQTTGVGVLANLAFDPNFKKYIGKKKNIYLFYKCMKYHINNVDVQTSFNKLLTNLAHDDKTGCMICNTGGINLIISAMNRHNSPVLHRSCCAVLSNLSVDNNNHEIILKAMALEALYDSYDEQKCDITQQLVDITLQNLSPRIQDINGENKTTSLHLASRNGNISIIRELLVKGMAINGINYNLFTPLNCAIQESNLSAIEYLILCGADISKIKTDINDKEMMDAIKRGLRKNKKLRKQICNIIGNIEDISQIIISYINLAYYTDMIE